MLTEKARYENKWGNFQALAVVLGKKQSDRWNGLTSVSYGTSDRRNDLLDIYALVMDNKMEISQMADSLTGDPIRRDLTELSNALGEVSQFFAGLSRETLALTHSR